MIYALKTAQRGDGVREAKSGNCAATTPAPTPDAPGSPTILDYLLRERADLKNSKRLLRMALHRLRAATASVQLAQAGVTRAEAHINRWLATLGRPAGAAEVMAYRNSLPQRHRLNHELARLDRAKQDGNRFWSAALMCSVIFYDRELCRYYHDKIPTPSVGTRDPGLYLDFITRALTYLSERIRLERRRAAGRAI